VAATTSTTSGRTDVAVGGGTKQHDPAPTTTSPPVTAPPGTISPEDPGVTTTPSTPPPVEPAPTIGGFRASRGTRSCSGAGQVPVVFAWSSTGATAGQLGPTGGLASSVAPSGTFKACTAPGAEWTLVVTGPGGRATRTASAPSA